MISSLGVLQSYLEGLSRLIGAQTTTLFVPPAESSRGLLLRVGEGEGLPELCDLETATAACRRLGDESGGRRISPSENGSILHFASSSSHGLLLRVATRQKPPMALAQSAANGRRQYDDHREEKNEGEVWLGLRFESELASASSASDDAALQLPAAMSEEFWPWLLAVGGTLVWHERRLSELLDDEVTGLPGRLQFQDLLARALTRSRERGTPVTLLFVNPDDFDSVNARFGSEQGDRALGEIGYLVGTSLRSSDIVARYGAAVFAAILADTPLAAGERVAEKLRQDMSEAVLLGEIRLGYSVGVAGYDGNAQESCLPNDLIRYASRALHAARLAGGDQVALWDQLEEAQAAESADRLSDIFTGDPVKDYRNMLLLWGSVRAVAATGSEKELITEALDHLMKTMAPLRAALLARDEAVGVTMYGVERVSPKRSKPLAPDDLGEEADRLMEGAEERLKTATETTPDGGQRAAFPLLVGERCVGSLYLELDGMRKPIDSSDILFLEALASQLGVALDRARLAEREHARSEREKQRLEAEVRNLRDALDDYQLIYRSAEMEELLATLRRVAPTDATVLITGESGTGKELLARTVHELSPRARRSLVVVDCGSIPPTLMESELFGHERGAYTGAERTRVGRVAEANGSTLFLDEIGELPQEVQAKLLRFVQERQFTPVGGNRTQTVDVRIIAATNRDLANEVTAGHFREDLYYRLSVVTLEAPPLRQRPDDIPLLARHFVQRAALRYGKDVRGLSPEAEALLSQYRWPGNVRELQNRISEAVILCEATELTPPALRLPLESGGSRLLAGRPSSPAEAAATSSPADDAASVARLDPWQDLELVLGSEIEAALADPAGGIPPLGKWLAEDLVLAAEKQTGGSARLAASLLGLPESTLRRRLGKIRDQQAAGLLHRSEDWSQAQAALAEIVDGVDAEKSLDRSRRLLLRAIVEHSLPAKSGARLLGVSGPTYQRRLAELDG